MLVQQSLHQNTEKAEQHKGAYTLARAVATDTYTYAPLQISPLAGPQLPF